MREPGGERVSDFTALYRAHASDVYRFALYLCGDRADAEDITSETFVRAWTAPEPIRASTVRAYLFTIARNLFLHGRRRASHHVPLADDLPDREPDPHLQVQRRDELRAVLGGMQELPEIDRAALAMRAFGEMSYEEIAQALAISAVAARVKVHRARLALAGLRKA